MRVCACMRGARVYVRACVRACVCVCVGGGGRGVSVCVCADVFSWSSFFLFFFFSCYILEYALNMTATSLSDVWRGIALVTF